MNVIEINNVSKKFKEICKEQSSLRCQRSFASLSKKKEIYALRDVSFSVKKGEIFGLLGPNGAGKTTIINIITGLLMPDKGYVRVFGKDVFKDMSVLERVGFVSISASFHWAMKSRDILKFYCRLYGIPKEKRESAIKELVDFFGINYIMDRKFVKLSTGERMRLIFAKSLLHMPDLLLLDEPTIGLDPDIAIKLRNRIKTINKKFGTTILFTSHYMNEVEQLADRIAFINNGKIADIGRVQSVKLKKFESYDLIIKLEKIKNRKLLTKNGFKIKGRTIYKSMPIDKNISEVLCMLAEKNFKIVDVESRKPTLEDYFVKITKRRQA